MKKKIVRLTEDDLVRIVKRVVKEQIVDTGKSELETCITDILGDETIPVECTNCIKDPNVKNCKSCLDKLRTKIDVFDVEKQLQLAQCISDLKNKY